MAQCVSPPLTRATAASAAFIVFMMAPGTSPVLAATATVSYGFNGTPATASTLVAPKEPDSVTTTNTPVFRNVQSTTELDTGHTIQPAEAPAPQQAAPTAAAVPKTSIGAAAIISDDLKVYTIPLSYNFTPNLGIKVDIPIVDVRFDNDNGVKQNNTGIGDVSLTLKHYMGSETGLAALYSVLTAKFASGDANKGLGTGSYDLSLTEKVMKRLGGFRATLMGGITQPLNEPTILGHKVQYGTNVSYMGALEHSIGVPDLWFGVRGAGMHSFESKIDGIGLHNALTIVDVIPEFNYYFKQNAAATVGVILPVLTDYALPGGSNHRDIAVNVGVSVLF